MIKSDDDAELMRAAMLEVDLSLIDWFRRLSLVERLRLASTNAETLQRLADAASPATASSEREPER